MSYIVDIERVNHNGEGISKVKGITTFIPKTIVGDRVEIEIEKEYKKYNRGRVIKYINRSIKCVNPNCKYYYQCGGCHISNMDYLEQLLYKKSRVKDIFKRYLDKDVDFEIIDSLDNLKYRNKITLQVDRGRIGLYEARTNDIVEIDKCLLVSDKLNGIISELKKINLDKVREIVLRESLEEVMLAIKGYIDFNCLDLFKEVDTVILNDKVIKGCGYIIQKIRDLKFILSSKSFFQINNKQVVRLYDKVLEYASLDSDDKVIDLYCGTGTIGMYMARYCRSVLGIEINEGAIRDANKNKELNNINNIEFICGDVGKIIDSKYKASVIVVDPPRSGLDKRTKEVLLEIKPNKIVYVSCDTMTLVRDLEVLLEEYELVEGCLVDMFPQTYHVECVVKLILKK